MILLEKTIEMLSTNFKRFVLTLLMSCIGAVLLVVTIYFNEEYWNFEKETDKILKKGIAGTAMVNIASTCENEGFQLTLQEVMNKYPDMIESIGPATVYKTEEGGECTTNVYTLGLWNIELEEGEWYTPDNIPEGGIYAQYLGYEVEGPAIGTIYNLDSQGEYKAIVAGRLKKGSKCPDLISIADSRNAAGVATHSLDDKILYVNLEFLSLEYPMAMTWNEKYTIDEVKNAFREAGEANNCDINIAPMSNIFKELNYYNRDSIDVLNRLITIVVLSVTVLLMSVQIVAIMKNKHIYGVYIISGMKHKDIRYIVVIENIIRFILTILITHSVVLIYQNITVPSQYIRDIMDNILYDYVYIKVIILEVIIHLLTTIVPICVLNRMTPVKLMEEL